MVSLSIDDIRDKVRILLDEALTNESENFSESDDGQLDDIISSKVIEALRFVHGNAESSLLEPDTICSSTDDFEDISSGKKNFTIAKVKLPGFLRLVKAKSDSWNKVFTEHLTFDSPEYARQRDFYAMGTPERPMLFIDRHPGDTDYTAEFCSQGVELDSFVEYLKEPKIENDSVSVCSKLVDAYVYYLSALVLTVLNDAHADDYFNMSNVLMGVTAQQANQG